MCCFSDAALTAKAEPTRSWFNLALRLMASCDGRWIKLRRSEEELCTVWSLVDRVSRWEWIQQGAQKGLTAFDVFFEESYRKISSALLKISLIYFKTLRVNTTKQFIGLVPLFPPGNAGSNKWFRAIASCSLYILWSWYASLQFNTHLVAKIKKWQTRSMDVFVKEFLSSFRLRR